VPLHRRSAHERSRAHAASGACDDVPGYHDEAFRGRRPFGRAIETVKIVYSGVNPLRQCRLGFSCIRDTGSGRYHDHPKTQCAGAVSGLRGEEDAGRRRGAPKASSRPTPQRCRFRPACGARSSRPGRSATNWRARSRSSAASPGVGWTKNHHADVLTPGEKAFLDLSLQAWRSADSAGRKVLKQTLRQVANGAQEAREASRNAPVEGPRSAPR